MSAILTTAASSPQVSPGTLGKSPRSVDWIATDLDGTFLSKDHSVSPATKALYRRLTHAGLQIVIATGRSLRSVQRVMSVADFLDVRLFPGIYNNGAVIFGDSEDQILHQTVISPEIIHAFSAACYRWLDDRHKQGQTDLYLSVVANLPRDLYIDFMTKEWEEYVERWHDEKGRALNIRFTEDDFPVNERFTAISAMSSPSGISDLHRYLETDGEFQLMVQAKDLRLVQPISELLTVLCSDENKGVAIDMLRKCYPQRYSGNFLAIGDGENDLEMLRSAPVSFAMGQARPQVKEAAMFVAEANDRDGWVHAVKEVVQDFDGTFDWIATDVDGTFLDNDHRVSPQTRDAYRQLRERQVPVVVATGRSLVGVKDIVAACNFEELALFPGVYNNGAVVFGDNDRDVIHRSSVSHEYVNAFAKACYAWRDKIRAQSQPTELTVAGYQPSRLYLDFGSEYWDEYAKKWNEEPGEVLNMPFTDSRLPAEETFVAVMAVSTEEQIRELREHLARDPEAEEARLRHRVRLVCPTPLILQGLCADDSKASGLRMIQERYPEKYTARFVAIGDGSNDVEMLQMAPVSFAMEQAKPEVKTAATHVTASNSQEGWAKAMRRVFDLAPE